MRKKCVFIQMIVSGLVFFLIVLAARRPYGAEPPDAADGQGCLKALAASGKILGFCPLVRTDVKAEISGILAQVTVRQEFQNPFKTPIEAVYTFPLPHDAAVDDMTIRTGGRTIRGVIRRRREAREIYEQARAQGKMAALLDQERPNIFNQQVANILPGQNVEVVITYVETLPYEKGGYRFVFPMVVGPRYIPGPPVGRQAGGWSPDTASVPDASRITPPVAPKGTRSGHDISIEVSIDSGVPISNLRSTTHETVVLQRDTHAALLQLAGRAVIPNKDFILTYDVAGALLQDGLVTHRTGADGYFMLILQPPQRFTPDQVVPKELIFLLDTSGSMEGFPIEKAKETMKMALGSLYAHDTFNLITFSENTRILFPQPVPATASNLELARAFLDSSSGSGGTEMMRAVRAALAPSDHQGHIRIVCFMTDGEVGNDMDIIAEVQKHPNARMFAFGIGSAPNRFLLDTITREGRGAVEYVSLTDDAGKAAVRFHERISNPLLTDIALEWKGAPVAEIYPRRMPDLFSAEPLVICGRYAVGGIASLRVRGRRGADDFVRDLRIPLPDVAPKHEALARLWARRRIEALMAEDYSGIQQDNPRADIRDTIVALGLQHRIMTQFTSFVAVEERIVTEGGKPKRIEVPVEMPEGMRHESVFGAQNAAVQFISPTSIPKSTGVAGIAGGAVGGVVGGTTSAYLTAPPPAPPPRKVEPMRVGGNAKELQLIYRVEPIYPDLAARSRVEGVVLVEANVDEKGDVTAVRVIKGHPLLDAAAADAVRQWKYRPALLNGQAVRTVVTATVAFRLGTAQRYRLDPAVSAAVEKFKTGKEWSAGEKAFIRDGKAEISITMSASSEALKARLRAAGFEVVYWSESSLTAVGRIPLEKLEALLLIDEVRLIFPHFWLDRE